MISVFGLIFFTKCEPQCKNYRVIIIVGISVIVILICIKTYCMMRKSIIIVLVDYFKRIKDYYEKIKEKIPS